MATLLPCMKQGKSAATLEKSHFTLYKGCYMLIFVHVCILDFAGWRIELIFDKVDLRNFVINEFNPTFQVQGSGTRAL